MEKAAFTCSEGRGFKGVHELPSMRVANSFSSDKMKFLLKGCYKVKSISLPCVYISGMTFQELFSHLYSF